MTRSSECPPEQQPRQVVAVSDDARKASREGRRLCQQCGVHPRICVCNHCQPISGAPDLWVLQHPQEAGHSKGTLRVAQACLPGLRVLVGERSADFAALRDRLNPDQSALLFPGNQSQALEQATGASRLTWIIIDGTWRKARRILMTNPWLQALPAFHFQYPPESVYRIRRSGTEGGLSTVEAIAHLCSLTTPSCNTAPLRHGLEALVGAQLAQMPPAVRKRYG